MKLVPLSEQEAIRFIACRETIRANLKTCFEVGNALAEIRDNKLYREHWETFEAFCKAEFGMGKSHAYRLIGASGVKESVKASPHADKITTEAQTRALDAVPEEDREEVVEAAVAASPDGIPTPDGIRAAAETIVPDPRKKPEPTGPTIELDSTGFAIPEKLVEFWKRKPEVQALLTALSKVRVALRKAQEEDDPLFRPVCGKGKDQTWTALITSLDKAYTNVGLAVPYAVCPTCQGHLMKSCVTCQQRGFVSEFYYKNQFDSNSRALRETVCKPKEKK